MPGKKLYKGKMQAPRSAFSKLNNFGKLPKDAGLAIMGFLTCSGYLKFFPIESDFL